VGPAWQIEGRVFGSWKARQTGKVAGNGIGFDRMLLVLGVILLENGNEFFRVFLTLAAGCLETRSSNHELGSRLKMQIRMQLCQIVR